MQFGKDYRISGRWIFQQTEGTAYVERCPVATSQCSNIRYGPEAFSADDASVGSRGPLLKVQPPIFFAKLLKWKSVELFERGFARARVIRSQDSLLPTPKPYFSDRKVIPGIVNKIGPVLMWSIFTRTLIVLVPPSVQNGKTAFG